LREKSRIIVSSCLPPKHEAAILQRVIRPDLGDMSPEAAREILKLGFQESDHARMAELSDRAQDGTLSKDEQDELDGHINISHFIAFVQSKARMSLKAHSAGTSAA
jgi:hypothetical protein